MNCICFLTSQCTKTEYRKSAASCIFFRLANVQELNIGKRGELHFFLDQPMHRKEYRKNVVLRLFLDQPMFMDCIYEKKKKRGVAFILGQAVHRDCI